MGYDALRLAMIKKKITIESISDLTGLHRNTISNKLSGGSSFSIEEAYLIKDTLFSDYDLGLLFQRDKEAG